MKSTLILFVLLVSAVLAQRPVIEEKIHDKERAHPPIVAPKPGKSVPPPAGALVLFDGTELSKWQNPDWTVKEGYFQADKVNGKKPGNLVTKQSFGDCHLHVEWSVEKHGAGNSGIYLHTLYEVQVFNSYRDATKIYADGQAAAIYGQYPPSANACRPQGEWEVYDITFTAPRTNEDGTLKSPARMTVVHNGVTVQDDLPLTGPTGHYKRAHYPKDAGKKRPLLIQYHGDPVKYRNIWLVEK